ncbi:MAG: HAD family hydrolase [Candidatus Thermoplasmatota archaeon]|nr:HAD family hydrolase [Candidatus Thermoplasmatota archaeon]
MTGPTKAVFLDRDGVINKRRLTLVRKPRNLELHPGAAEAIARLTKAGYRVIVVTNQSGVGYNLIRQADLDAIHELLRETVEAHGGKLDAIYAATHRKGQPGSDAKPRPAMLERGAERFGLDPSRCWMVGDKWSDVEAGEAFGARTIWVHGDQFPWDRWRDPVKADFSCEHLAQAVDVILAEDGIQDG